MTEAVLIHIGFAKIYRYKGWLIEYDRNKPFGPWPLKKNGLPRKKAGRVFYQAFMEFKALTIEEQEQYRDF